MCRPDQSAATLPRIEGEAEGLFSVELDKSQVLGADSITGHSSVSMTGS
jgi:hypothetical protein